MSKSSDARPENKRKHIRFSPDLGILALIDLTSDRDRFMAEISGLVTTESHGGCGVVILSTSKLHPGSVCKVQVGKLPAMKAEVRWRIDLDREVIKLGLMYLE